MRYEYVKQGFLECVGLTWEEIDLQIQSEIQSGNCRTISENYEDVTYILSDNQRFQPNIEKVYQTMKDKYGLKVLHIYTSKNFNAKTFGRHCDDVNVLIVQSIGKMEYKFDNHQTICLQPGDGLHIPKGMYHEPIASEPRVTLSFSWS